MKLTQVINPFSAPPDSMTARTLAVANEAMLRAIQFAAEHAPGLHIEVVAAHLPEDEPSIPSFVQSCGTLSRTLMDVTDRLPRRKLPLIGDILSIGATVGTGDLLIYSNSDIGVQPHFYTTIADMASSTPSMCINRRNIDRDMTDLSQLLQMYAEPGIASLVGTDTFIFPRQHALGFDLGHVAIALPMIEYAVMANMDAASGFRTKLYRDLQLTFHHGHDGVWNQQAALCEFNENGVRDVCRRLFKLHPKYPAGSLFDIMLSTRAGVAPKGTKALRYKLLKAIGLTGKKPRGYS